MVRHAPERCIREAALAVWHQYRRPMRPPFETPTLDGRRAFTIVEVAVAATIIGVLAAISMPAFKRLVMSTRAAAVVNDLRVFSAAFQNHAQQSGNYPPNAGIGVMPPTMAGSLNQAGWMRVTPVNGRYKWNYNTTHAGTRYRASIGIRTQGANRVSNDLPQLLAIDRRIDDGNLTTGAFFIGAGNEPVFIIER